MFLPEEFTHIFPSLINEISFQPSGCRDWQEMWLPQSPTRKQMGLVFVALPFQGWTHDVSGVMRGGARPHSLKCCQTLQWDKEITDLGIFSLAEAKASMSGRKFPLFTEEIWLTLRKGKI